MKKNSLKRALALVLSLVMLFVFTGCTGKSNSEASAGNGAAAVTQGTADQIVIARLTDAAYLDPNAESIGGAEVTIMQQIYEGLVKSGEKGDSIEPSLAKDWNISADGLTYTFNLKPGIKFSDGTPVKGEDWVWSFYRARDTKTSAYAYIAEAIDKVEATDTTVTIHLKYPWAPFLADLCNFNMVVGSKAYFDKVGAQAYSDKPLGTGPYMLTEWVKDDHMLLEANPFYHEAGYPKTKKIKFTVVSDDNTRFMQLQAGQVDIVSDLPFTMANMAESDSNIKLDVFKSTQIRYLILNTTQPPFNNQAVRKALEYALNKKEMAEVIAGQYGGPAVALVSEAEGKWSNTDLKVEEYDPAKAKQMLADAGFPNGVDFTLTIRSGSEVYEQIATLIQASVKDAGFNCKIEKLESAAVREKYEALTHQATILMWIDDIIDPSGVSGWTVDYDQCKAWYTGLNDEALDKLNTDASKEMDEAKRIKMYWDIQSKIKDNANVMPLFKNGFAYASQKSVQGLYVSPFGVMECAKLTKTK
ncbi:MAG: ABC transporter substrate-binding protein [Caulobacteraceae bacterium]